MHLLSLLSDTVRIRRLKLFGHVARADKSQDHSRALQACISPAARNWRRRPGRWRKICANLILASRQGFGELKTEQLGGHSQEQQRHRQAPIDDDGFICVTLLWALHIVIKQHFLHL